MDSHNAVVNNPMVGGQLRDSAGEPPGMKPRSSKKIKKWGGLQSFQGVVKQVQFLEYPSDMPSWL